MEAQYFIMTTLALFHRLQEQVVIAQVCSLQVILAYVRSLNPCPGRETVGLGRRGRR
jgi:hypothetical protein